MSYQYPSGGDRSRPTSGYGQMPQTGPQPGGFNQGNIFGDARPVSYQGPGAPRRTQRPQAGGFRTGMSFAVLYVVSIWAVHLINTFVFGGFLTHFGIHPWDISSMWGILTAPLLHVGFDHLISNTVPGAIFSFFIGATGRRTWWEVTGIVVVLGGLGTWLLGGLGTNHVGASGLVYGWLCYLVWRGLFNRSFRQVILGVVLGFMYAGLIWGVLPNDAGVSWQAHLCGALAGIVAGMVITSDDPPRPNSAANRQLTY
ncbi:rhomboid family intramembrane serine protease [Corynebacterium incognita]|uniref:Rhomboid family intramembrane serine protease n=1 Tax=Corynebacterium incognita TaxID=2754725 RepID=A0A7G7CR74_9CORY|nr:rhomboid family intramembrane serine protease [Corynebacterium incognita]